MRLHLAPIITLTLESIWNYRKAPRDGSASVALSGCCMPLECSRFISASVSSCGASSCRDVAGEGSRAAAAAPLQAESQAGELPGIP